MEHVHYVLAQAFIQLICWRYIFDFTKSYISANCRNQRWFINWSNKPYPMGGETGDERLISSMGVVIQHFFGGVCVALAYCLNSPQLFVLGVLSEFSLEVLDVFEMVRQRFVTKKGVYSEAMFSQSEVAVVVMHHSGAFTVMLPACIYYADNEYVQQIALGLLGFTSILMVFSIWNNTRDVYDLKERGQFVVSYFVMFVCYVYFRWYVTVDGMYSFVYHEWGSISNSLRVMLVVYGILIKMFDCMYTPIMIHQLYQWLFTEKAMVRPTKITKTSLKRPSLIPVTLMRMQSTPF